MKTYGIRSDYTPNAVAVTREDDGDVYWTPARVRRSVDYQHHVYALAAGLARSGGLETVLDVGCGPGLKARRHFTEAGREVTLVDQLALAPVVERTAPGLEFVAVDLDDPAVDLGRTFDLVVCADVLEHLIDPDSCLDFVRAHLDAGGVAVFSTPEREILRGPECRESPKPEHVREWASAEFRAYLESRGFAVSKHEHLPPERLTRFEDVLRGWLGSWLGLSRWSSCQVAVCSPAREAR